MKQKRKHLFTMLTCLALLAGCAPRYQFNFDFPPPYINARLNEVFPSHIKNFPRQEERLDFPEEITGFRARYNQTDYIMLTIKCKDLAGVKPLFEKNILPAFASLKHKKIIQEDPTWWAYGESKAGSLSLAWINQNWIFKLTAADEEKFKLLVRASRFVEIPEEKTQ